jgi:hypothetical protein
MKYKLLLPPFYFRRHVFSIMFKYKRCTVPDAFLYIKTLVNLMHITLNYFFSNSIYLYQSNREVIATASMYTCNQCE